MMSKVDINVVKRNIVQEMYKLGCFKTGTFTLNSGNQSDFYIDLRDLTHHPKLLNDVAGLIANEIKQQIPNLRELLIAGIPYGAIPLATLVSQHLESKMLMVRKKPKDHGTQQQIEGLDKLKNEGKGYRCVLVDDIVTSGKSIRTMLDIFHEKSEISVIHTFVFLDREDDSKKLSNPCTSVFTLTEVKSILRDLGVHFASSARDRRIKGRKTFTERSKMTKNSMTKTLFEIIDKKKTNLVVSIDFKCINQVYEIINQVKDSVCAIKLHSDTWENGSQIIKQYSEMIATMAIRHNFLVFEDRKFADIGSTVQQQYSQMTTRYNRLDLMTVLPIFGEGTVTSLNECVKRSNGNVGMMLVAEGSSVDNLFSPTFAHKCMDIAYKNDETVSGIICQRRVSLDNRFVYMTPGVHLSATTDGSDQKYRSPSDAIIRDDCDVIIVGRGITHLPLNQIEQESKRYASKAYQCYQQKLYKIDKMEKI